MEPPLRAAFLAIAAPEQPPARDRRYGRTPRPRPDLAVITPQG